MKNSKFLRLLCLPLCATFLFSQNALAWDSVGHRLSAAVAVGFLSDSNKQQLGDILRQHPRYQQDFLDQMPASVAQSGSGQQLIWLLGQAAFWPDITRGLPDAERQKYNRANWHYIDGAWLRGKATIQGNSYVGLPAFTNIAGEAASAVRTEAQVDNVMTALDYNSELLANRQTPAAQRALALCWVLHLFGDIHQPLHVGSLYSANVFPEGDRGGNGIVTDDGNLHARWDRALRSAGISRSLQIILTQQNPDLDQTEQETNSDWSQWMQESRLILLESVYTQQMKSAIAELDSSGGRLQEFTLDANYVAMMEETARQQLALAGRRIAHWFESNLD